MLCIHYVYLDGQICILMVNKALIYRIENIKVIIMIQFSAR